MRNGTSAVFCLICCPLLVAQQASTPTPASTNPDSGPVAAAPPQPSRPPQPHTLMDGTPVKLRLSETISSSNARVGQEIPFEVVEDVKVDDVAVLPKGATAIGTVTDCNAKKSMGRAGKLNISISYARLTDQEKVALRAMQDNKGGGHVGAMTGAMVATSIVFFPAAPLFLFIHGKDITLPQGTEITAFVEGDLHLDMAKFAPAPPAPAIAAPASQASLLIDSAPSGADIEVDGAFVGNTPSTVSMAPGNHQIAVKKKGFTDWTKALNVTGGSVHLNAELEAAVPSTPAPAPAPAQTSAPAAPQPQ
jgi:PEGA domain